MAGLKSKGDLITKKKEARRFALYGIRIYCDTNCGFNYAAHFTISVRQLLVLVRIAGYLSYCGADFAIPLYALPFLLSSLCFCISLLPLPEPPAS